MAIGIPHTEPGKKSLLGVFLTRVFGKSENLLPIQPIRERPEIEQQISRHARAVRGHLSSKGTPRLNGLTLAAGMVTPPLMDREVCFFV
jgi:hypothetical protein